MSVCLIATAWNRQKVGMNALVCTLFFLSLFIFYTNCVMPGPFCSLLSLSLLLFPIFSSGYARQEYITKNSDHHIVFDVTVNSRARVLSTFFSLPTSVYCPFAFVIIRLLDWGFFYLTCKQRKKKRRERRELV